jgi:insulysin
MVAAAISVNVGNFNDPPDRRGLAHFLEHMIFLGSEKYPEENVFFNLIANNGGFANAYTSTYLTNY